MIWEAAPQDAVKAALPPGLQHAVIDPLEQPGADGRYDYLAPARANLAAWRAITAPGA
ncbi:MAG: hypothetical protein HC882_07480 [Acidobacteria bacterium]|nr:hypothetical protein [Acidobacteriota bacterium]